MCVFVSRIPSYIIYIYPIHITAPHCTALHRPRKTKLFATIFIAVSHARHLCVCVNMCMYVCTIYRSTVRAHVSKPSVSKRKYIYIYIFLFLHVQCTVYNVQYIHDPLSLLAFAPSFQPVDSTCSLCSPSLMARGDPGRGE